MAVVWSFGNNLRDYLYSKDIEPLKKAIHYAIFFSDYSLAKTLGHDLSFIDAIADTQERYLAVKHYFKRTGNFKQQSIEGQEQPRLQSAESHERISNHVFQKKNLEMESKDRVNRIVSLAIPRATNLSASHFGGGRYCPSQAVCLTIPRWRYLRTA